MPRFGRAVVALHLSEPSGPSRALQPFLQQLATRADVVVAVPSHGRAGDEFRDFARVVAVGHEQLVLPRTRAEGVALAAALRRDVRRFRALLRRERADLAIIATIRLPTLVLAARLEGLPTVVYAGETYRHGAGADTLRGLWGRLLLAANARWATEIVACSQAVADTLPAPRGRVVYPPIDLQATAGDRDSFLRAYGVPPTRPLIATLGNVSRPRGQDVAIRALADLRRDRPGARLVIAGAPHARHADRMYADEIAGLARELGVDDAVHMCGFTDPADVFAASDVVVNPARFAEPFGIVAMEALVAGRPVVSTRVGAVPEVLTHREHALLVPPDRPDELADAVRALLDDRELADRLVAQGRAHVRAFYSAERQVPRFEEAVAAAVARHVTTGRPDLRAPQSAAR